MSHLLKTNLVAVVKKYLHLCRVPFTSSHLTTELTQNPHYPTLYSISHILSRYNIPNEAYVLEPEQLSQLETPFITYYSGGTTGKDFILVSKITNSQVTYYSEPGKPIEVSKDVFINHWEKIVLAAEPNPASKEVGYEKNRKIERLEQFKRIGLISSVGLLILMLLATVLSPLSSNALLAAVLITITKALGIAITVLLLLYDYDKTNTVVNNFCSAGKQTGCDAVINGKAGKIFGIKWSEAGFFYFASGLLMLLFPGIGFQDKVSLFSITATAVSPFILFSIYYQAKVAKQWCPLCLATQVILLMEAAWSVWVYWLAPTNLSFAAPIAIALATSITLPLVLWFTVKNVLYRAKDSATYEAAYRRLLYSPDHFERLLEQQDTAAAGWQQLGITIGNPDASTTIIKVCNPYCGPCAQAHPVLEKLISENSDINLRIIFTASNEENDRGRKPVSHLLAIAEYDGSAAIEKALDEWYAADKKDYETFAAKYPKNGELAKQADKITAMKEWCKKTSITHTPTFFINGKKLPETYNIKELKNIF